MTGREQSPNPNSECDRLARENAELRRSHARLQAAVEKFQSIIDALPVSLQIVDAEGRITGINPYHLDNMGAGRTTVDDYLGQYIVARRSIVQAGLSRHYRRTLLGEGFDATAVHFRITSGDRVDRYSNIRGRPLYREGEIVGAVFISEDVTEFQRVQHDLKRHQEQLEEMVVERTRELQQAYTDLEQEYQERRRAEAEKEEIIAQLQEALAQVKMLSGFLPICAYCKKVRDDSGYWQQIEAYISEHSQAEFSHSMCPDCTDDLRRQLQSLNKDTGSAESDEADIQ